MAKKPQELHIFPGFSQSRPHEQVPDCWCEPELVNEEEFQKGIDKEKMYIHRGTFHVATTSKED